MSEKYLQELLEEKDLLDANIFVHSIRLIEDEIIHVSKGDPQREEYHGDGEPGRKKPRYRSYTGAVVTEETVKLSEKVVVPVKEYPKFNFVGKLLGPRGNTLKRLQQATQTRMSILGKGSTRNRDKEEELRNSDDPKFEHLNEPLHVLIEVEAPKSEAHARLAAALAEVTKYMIPENDDIREDQMREMALINNFGKNPNGRIRSSALLGGRGRGGLGGPIVRVGIPPPGAIILNGQQGALALRGRGGRVVGGRGRSAVAVPRHAAPSSDPYAAYDAYDSTYDAAYEGYPETGDSMYDYQDDYSRRNSSNQNRKPFRENHDSRRQTSSYSHKEEDSYRRR